MVSIRATPTQPMSELAYSRSCYVSTFAGHCISIKVEVFYGTYRMQLHPLSIHLINAHL